jgi:outer membrane cobalamin receptor
MALNNAAGGISTGGDHGSFSLYGSYQNSAGINSCHSPLACGVVEPDRDGYDNLAGSALAGYRFGRTQQRQPAPPPGATVVPPGRRPRLRQVQLRR